MQIYRHYACYAAAITLSGCASPNTPAPAVQIKTVTVYRDVQRPCAVTVPVRPTPLAKPYPSDAVALAAELAMKLTQWSGPGGYGDRAADAIKRCTAVTPAK